MKDLNTFSGKELLSAVKNRRASVREVAAACLERVAEREPLIQAFAHHDPDMVRRSAGELDRIDFMGGLHGLPIGIKDLVDTVSYPTEFGSPIYSGRRPKHDAAVVTKVLAAGALLIGKTVSTEFALFHPGPTKNPLDPTRTPGGSSSGSAAATADYMVTAAIGTQTAGSVIRPSAYCGVVGFKPTFGIIDRTGVKLISPTLDTIGIFARNVEDVITVFQYVREDPIGGQSNSNVALRYRRLGLLKTSEWERADIETRRGIEGLASFLTTKGYAIIEVTLPPEFEQLMHAQEVVMEAEAARCLGNEFREHFYQISDSTRKLIERGSSRSPREYDEAIQRTSKCRSMLRDVFSGIDAILTLGVVGEAPIGLESTGSPIFCRIWTLLHIPAISLPLLQGPHGLPIGVQLVSALRNDDSLLRLARELMHVVFEEGQS